MAFLTGGANSADSVLYSIENSIRWEDGSSPKLSDDIASTSASWTFSAWVKRGDVWDANSYIISWGTSGTDGTGIGFADDNKFFYYSEDSPNILIESARIYKDPSGWYHCVVKCDSGTVTLYINGASVASGSGGNALDSSTVRIGCWVGDNLFHDGYLSEVYFIDGTAYSASTFGKSDSASGIWIPKNASPTYGTHGFRMEFKQTGTGTNASGMGADTSGNDNHFAVSNLVAIDIVTDTPTNNFCVINPLFDSQGSAAGTPLDVVLTNGNLSVDVDGIGSNLNWAVMSTFGFASGKWYYEFKYDNPGNGNLFGGNPTISPNGTTIGRDGGTFVGSTHGLSGRAGNSNSRGIAGHESTSGIISDFYNETFPFDADNDIAGMFINMDDKELIIHQNGSLVTGTGKGDWSSSNLYYQGGIVSSFWQTRLRVTDDDQGPGGTYNFGNPPYALSSGNADANGYGNFEYDPAIGGVNYYALCTKNLAEFG